MSKKTTAADLERLTQHLECYRQLDWDQYHAIQDADSMLGEVINMMSGHRQYMAVRLILSDIRETIRVSMGFADDEMGIE